MTSHESRLLEGKVIGRFSRGCVGKHWLRTFGSRGWLGSWWLWAPADPPTLRDPGGLGAERRRRAPTHDLTSAIARSEVVRPPEASSETTARWQALGARGDDPQPRCAAGFLEPSTGGRVAPQASAHRPSPAALRRRLSRAEAPSETTPCSQAVRARAGHPRPRCAAGFLQPSSRGRVAPQAFSSRPSPAALRRRLPRAGSAPGPTTSTRAGRLRPVAVLGPAAGSSICRRQCARAGAHRRCGVRAAARHALAAAAGATTAHAARPRARTRAHLRGAHVERTLLDGMLDAVDSVGQSVD